MQYFFILGNNPALSAAELISWFELHTNSYNIVVAEKSFMIIETPAEIPAGVMQVWGGVIKFGQIRAEEKKFTPSFEWLDALTQQYITDKKFFYGFSVYPGDKKLSYALRGVGLELKKELKARGVSARLVQSKQENLSSVVVQKNKLVSEQGCEVVVLQIVNKTYIGKTIAVQAFEDLGKRDFGRPAADAYSGMLPPKLAQIMINMAQVKKDYTVLDPFCGSGTVVQELLLQGVERVFASDKSEKAVKDTRENIAWLEQEFQVATNKTEITERDARQLAQYIKIPVNAVVTEPYLGPPARGKRTQQEIQKITSELTRLYMETFSQFHKIVTQGGRVVMVWPVHTLGKRQYFLSVEKIVPKGFKKINVLPETIRATYPRSERGTLLYDRNNQPVKREIMVFERV